MLIKVGMADLKTCRYPDALTTLGLGSCVGVALYDPVTKIGGLAHVMLPDSTQIHNNENIAKFADTGVAELVRQMILTGAPKSRMVAKIAGGAQMFAFKNTNADNILRVGDRNVEAVRKALAKEGIFIAAQDVGQSYGRTVELYTDDGRFVIRAVGREVRTI